MRETKDEGKREILTCDLKRVGKANETLLQSVTMHTGGAMMFRTDLRHARAVPDTISNTTSEIIPPSANEDEKTFRKRRKTLLESESLESESEEKGK